MIKHLMLFCAFIPITTCAYPNKIVDVNLRIQCGSSVTAILKFTNVTEEPIGLRNNDIAQNGKLYASSFELWDGTTFARYTGGHFVPREDYSYVSVDSKKFIETRIALDSYYDIPTNKEYKIRYLENGYVNTVNRGELLVSLETNDVVITKNCRKKS